MSPTTDPLGDAIVVLEHVAINEPSARSDTEDAHNRVVLALSYLRHADQIMRDLAKDLYVKSVMAQLGGYDHDELVQARKVLRAARLYADDPASAETKLAVHVAVEVFDEWERRTWRPDPPAALSSPETE